MVDALSYPTKGSHRLSDDWDDHIRRGSLGGVDFPVAYGTEVFASHDGFLAVDNSSAGSGGRVATVQGGGITTQCLHMSSFARGNGNVSRGELIGYSGASAYGSDYGTGGPHVHWHAIVNGRRVNPLLYLATDAASDTITPIEEDDMFSDNDKYALELVLGAAARMELGVYGITKKTDIIAWATTDDSQGLRRMVADLTAIVKKGQSGQALSRADLDALAAAVAVPTALLEKVDSSEQVEADARAKLASKDSILSKLPELEARGIKIKV